MVDKLDVRPQAEKIATSVADRCQGKRPKGAAPQRYAIIWQAARLGAIDALTATLSTSTPTEDARDMPTIWEDPAGKGYPCFERPMTPTEARDTIKRMGRNICALKEALGRLVTTADQAAHALNSGMMDAAIAQARTALSNKETDRHGVRASRRWRRRAAHLARSRP